MRISLLIASLVAVILISCGGRTKHVITTGESGLLDGMMFEPQDHSRYLEVDTNFQIYWVVGKPPQQFEVSLNRINEDGDYVKVLTTLKQVGEYSWRITPVGRLYEGTFYALVVKSTSPVQVKEAWFMTKRTYGTSKGKEDATNQPVEGAKEVHTITLYSSP